MKKDKVIIVEDDEITSLNLNISLQKHGYNVISLCDNASDAKEKIETLLPDVIIIDISLQESSDGIELAKKIKEKHNIPFIYLTSYSDDDIIAEAKLTEPYGYIVKPFDPNSLHATIQMALFKHKMEKERRERKDTLKKEKTDIKKLLLAKKLPNRQIVPFGKEYHLDIIRYEIFYKDKKIKLTKKERTFLYLLVAKLGLIVTFEEAINYVWEESGATQNSVRTLVWRLRSKLKTDIIKNASGSGYYIEE